MLMAIGLFGKVQVGLDVSKDTILAGQILESLAAIKIKHKWHLHTNRHVTA